jgi:membrane associated rhomboid family serine protease
MVKILIIFNVSFYLVQEIMRIDWFMLFGLVPALVWKGYVWQMVTYMFLHGSFLHIFLNMFVLWMFGGQLEREWGANKFLRYFFITGIGAALCTVIVNPGSIIPTIGASGAIYGLLLAYGLTYPNSIIYLYFLLPIKAKYFVIFFGIIEFIATISPSGDMVAHLAHLGGMLFGFIYLKRGVVVAYFARKVKNQMHIRRMKQQKKKYEEEQKIRAEVDELLDKINRLGIENLTKGEKKRLDEASRFLRENSK